MKYLHFHDIFRTFNYPAGEPHVRMVADDPTQGGEIVIESNARNFDDLCVLVIASGILRKRGIVARFFVPYFPFARHDRRIDDRDGLEVYLALSLANMFDIVIADPHSDVTGSLRHIPQSASVAQFEKSGLFEGDPIVIVPDEGARNKALAWAGTRTIVQCMKTRDPRTGQLSGFEVGRDDLGGRPCVIVDDICDGGGTFIGLAKELRKRNAGPLRLAVTHGLFTKGLDCLWEFFSEIYTFGSLSNIKQPIILTFQSLYEDGFTHDINHSN